MSQFTSAAVLELLDDYKFRVVEAFEFYEGDAAVPVAVYTVPVGFETDLASVPRWLWWILPPHGRYAKAAILHDWLCRLAELGEITRAKADAVFLVAMRVLNVPEMQALIMYRAVRAWSVYRQFSDLRLLL